MYIKDNRKAKTVTFAIIKIGEVFLDVNDTEAFCMKINSIYTEDHNCINAINLETGSTYTFNDDEEVEKVSATMTVN
jgi:hypothetical protein